MTYKQFIDKNLGRFIDFDKAFGYQCTDLMRQFLQDVLGLSGWAIPPAQYAKYMFKRFPVAGDKNFTKIFNTPSNVPKQGDIVFWDTYPLVTGIAGHVAIFDSGNVNSFVSFDQNYPKNSPCKFVKHSYKGVMGWLRPRLTVK